MTQSVVRVDEANGLVDSDVPLHEYSDASHGAAVSLVAGVHGGEYAPMLVLGRSLNPRDESRS
jgi:succinylglutamate desuccinylase